MVNKERRRQKLEADFTVKSTAARGTQLTHSHRVHTNLRTHAQTGQWSGCGCGDKRNATQAQWAPAWESQREMLPFNTRQSSVSSSA